MEVTEIRIDREDLLPMEAVVEMIKAVILEGIMMIALILKDLWLNLKRKLKIRRKNRTMIKKRHHHQIKILKKKLLKKHFNRLFLCYLNQGKSLRFKLLPNLKLNPNRLKTSQLTITYWMMMTIFSATQ
jgi:hypothetical protein